MTYIPDDLVSISDKRLILTNPSMKLRAVAHSKLNDMAQEFYQIFGDKLVIVSAYRSYEYQKKLKK
jgi:LAS superfamily LD-carboxypeptidase LdcB